MFSAVIICFRGCFFLTPSLPQLVKLSGLNDAGTHLQTVYFPVL